MTFAGVIGQHSQWPNTPERVDAFARAYFDERIAMRARGELGAAPLLLSAPVALSNHPDGLPHVRNTIGKMAKLARQGAQSYEIRNLATRITADVPSKDYRGELAALYKWVRDTIRYRKDPDGLEWVQAPRRTVLEQAGDCDDMATLLAAFSGALGHRWYFDTVGPSPTVQKHVATVVELETGPITLDPVLEPMQSTTAPRADLGAFGMRAMGSHRRWSSEGHMLGFVGSAVDARGRKLWDWNPYYPPVGVALQSGMQPPQGGRFTTPAYPYHLREAPGWAANGRPLRGMPMHGSALAGPLGISFFKRIGRIVKGIGKGAGKVIHVAGKIARNPIVQAGANVVMPGAGAALQKGGAYEGKAETIVRGITHKLSAAAAAPHPAIAKRYPKSAQQVFDPRHGIFRIYVPSGVAGLAGIRPALSFSLGAASASSAQAAVASVRAYIGKYKKSPTVSVAEVRAFQAADGVLTADGQWGPNTRKAAAWYLAAPESSLPAIAPALTKTHAGAPVPITWHPPAAATPAAQAPSAAAARPAAVPRLPPPAPPGTPAAIPPAPMPGYVEVGHESQNPGLAPLSPAAASGAVSPAAAGRTAAQKAATAARRGKAAPAAVVASSGRTAAQKSATAARRGKAAPAALAPVGTLTPIDVTGGGAPAVIMPAPIMTPGPGYPGMTTAQYAGEQQPGAGGESTDNSKLMWAAIAYLYYRQQQRRKLAA